MIFLAGRCAIAGTLAHPAERMHTGSGGAADGWIKRAGAGHACQCFAKLVHRLANPDYIWIGQGQEFHVVQGEFHHVTLTVVAVVGNDQGILQTETLKLRKSVFNGNDIRNVLGLFGKGQRLTAFHGRRPR